MTVEQANVVDGMGIDSDAGEFVMLISDHLGWDDQAAHFAALEAKLAGYVEMITSRQYLEHAPAAEGVPVRVKLVCQQKPPEAAEAVLQAVEAQLKGMGIRFLYEPLPAGY